ncbi:MAG: sigma-70 family RNA polymerase sigma factor [Bacteroidales bacterium]|nr:sigma-70 family RNA polymerase sigma factor [Bacteroidales bacterium]
MAKNIILPNATIAVLNDFVGEQRDNTLSWLMSKGLNRNDAEDLFQDAFLTLYEQLHSGYLAEMPRSLAAYFHGIVQNKLKEQFRQMQKILDNEDVRDVSEFNEDFLNEVLSQEDARMVERKEAAVREVVRNLPEPCNKLLWGFYFDRYSMQELADLYGYKTASSVKVMKSRCMTKFEAAMKQIYNEMFND